MNNKPTSSDVKADDSKRLGDIPSPEFRAAMHRVADMVADFLQGVGDYRVVPKINPGDVRKQLPASPPAAAEALDQILDDYRRIIEPNTTHWNHPGFLAYFSITGSGPGILGEALAAGLNINTMLWRTGPAATELEELVCDWMRQMLDLPPEFRGHINDTASVASMLALAAARQSKREYDIRRRGMAGRPELPAMTVYASEHAHSSIDKAAITLGLGLDNLRRIPSDDAFRLDLNALRAAITADRKAGYVPICVVATAGTTSTTSVDPLRDVAAICRAEQLWMHVDAAYGGSAAVCPEYRKLLDGLELADSIVTNPHKWLFTPVDCSVMLVRNPDILREAFSVVPEYLRTSETDVINLMDYGVQLGRRFRALKLWMVIRAFGVDGLRARLRNHCAMAREFAGWLEADGRFEICAPYPFSTVCFRAVPDLPATEQDRFNEQLLERVNEPGMVFLSHTKLHDRYVLRLTIGNLRTTRAHIQQAWELIGAAHDQLAAPPGA